MRSPAITTASARTTRTTPRRRGGGPSTSSDPICRGKPSPRLCSRAALGGLAAAIALFALTGSGCGGDEETSSEPPRTETVPAETTETAATETEKAEDTESETAPTGDGHGGGHETPTSPEDQEGGAGDEVPARAEAMLTGRGGRITPRVVQVPPFISVRIVLRSADGRSYALRFGDRSVRAGGAVGSASIELDGLRPGKAYVGTEESTGVRVRVEATAEPGP